MSCMPSKFEEECKTQWQSALSQSFMELHRTTKARIRKVHPDASREEDYKTIIASAWITLSKAITNIPQDHNQILTYVGADIAMHANTRKGLQMHAQWKMVDKKSGRAFDSSLEYLQENGPMSCSATGIP